MGAVDDEDTILINEYLHYTGPEQASLEDIANSAEYEYIASGVANLGLSSKWHYVKFYYKNDKQPGGAFYYIDNPSISHVELFRIMTGDDNKKVALLGKNGACMAFANRPSKTTSFLFNLQLTLNEEGWFLLKLTSNKPILVSSRVGNKEDLIINAGYNDDKTYLYIGIIFALLCYNFFLAFSTHDPEHWFYILYLGSVGMVQITTSGIGSTTFWPESTWWSQHATHLFGVLSGIFTMLFVRKFIRTKKYTPIIDKIIIVYLIFSTLVIPLIFLDKLILVYNLINFNAISSLILLTAGIIAIRKGSIPARYFIVAWSVFLISVIVFALKDYGILPYNTWTANSVAIGSSFEGILLSFAIANKINILKKQKEEATRKLIQNVKNQKEILEIKVHERTQELEKANDKIKTQYNDLVIAQKKLIESEKMAGLGQMTAGIAHELNNPINFVSSNVLPLERDINDVIELLDSYVALGEDTTNEDLIKLKEVYTEMDIDYTKEEIKALLKGIEEGARRTTEIVKGLRIFARSDQDNLICANINDCLHSSLVVLKSVTSGTVTLTKDFDPNIPSIYCYPGKLNQVIVNLISNAVHATNLPGRTTQTRNIHVSSFYDEEYIHISIKDNGSGIDDAIKEKMFMPFFTTKGVNVGTGLGLSITIGIIKEHNGKIEVITEKGKGSEFIIHLPRLQEKQSETAA